MNRDVSGLGIMLTALALNLLGDGLRDVVNPRLKERGGAGPGSWRSAGSELAPLPDEAPVARPIGRQKRVK